MATRLHCTILELSERMTPVEMRAWQLYLTSEPRGERRQDWQSAQVVQAILSIAAGLSSSSKPIRLEDCILKFEIETPETRRRKTTRALAMLFAEYIPEDAREAMIRGD